MRYRATFEILDMDELIQLSIVFYSEPDLTDSRLSAIAKKKLQQWLDRYDSNNLHVNNLIEQYALED